MTFEKSTCPAIAFLSLWLFACAEPESGANGAGGEGSAESRPPQLRGECPPVSRIGGFFIGYVIGEERTDSYVEGRVADAPLAVSIPEELDAAGPCRLLRTSNPFCDPRCAAAQICVEGDCVPQPRNLNVGSVFIEGLVEPTVMEPSSVGNRYSDTTLPHPPFEPGSPIKLSVLGGELEGFTLYGDGVAPLQSDGEAWRVEPGQELVIAWEADTDHAATVSASLDVNQHGVSPGRIACQGPDTGSFTVPAELIDRILDMGVSGFPTASLRRYTADSIELDAGCVDLIVFAPLSPEVTVASHVPCEAPEDCPDGKSCDLDSNTCV
jgi:hypothetical protein